MANEKRLISAKELERQIKEALKDNPYAMGQMLRWIRKQPTVDAVEVVRCKDCVSYEEQCPSFGYCYHWDYEQGMSPNQVDGDDFCSYGERKDNDL